MTAWNIFNPFNILYHFHFSSNNLTKDEDPITFAHWIRPKPHDRHLLLRPSFQARPQYYPLLQEAERDGGDGEKKRLGTQV